jgi:AcrR family transcriptional regulator
MADDLSSVKIGAATTRRRGRYHHGALRDALISIGEDVLIERGAAGFSMREVTRRAGVSPAAHLHHFKDAAALLTALATQGFARLTGTLAGAVENRTDVRSRLEAQAVAYIDFALKNGELFTLMWRRDVLDVEDPAYLLAGRAAFNVFERAALGRDVPVAAGPHKPDAAVIAAWAMMHGYARLALDGAFGDQAADLLPAVLQHLPPTPGVKAR